MPIINSRKSYKRLTAKPLQGSEAEQIRERSIKRAGAFYLPDTARFQYLLNLPESENIGQAITDAMKAIEAENAQVNGVLPKTYNRLEKSTLFELLRIMEQIPMDIEGDAFGKGSTSTSSAISP